MKQPYEECPQFDRCSCNVCPLDPEQNEKEVIEGDAKCKAEKPTRLRIGDLYPELLPMQGFTQREWRNKQKWEAKTPAERELISTRLRNALKNYKDGALNDKGRE